MARIGLSNVLKAGPASVSGSGGRRWVGGGVLSCGRASIVGEGTVIPSPGSVRWLNLPTITFVKGTPSLFYMAPYLEDPQEVVTVTGVVGLDNLTGFSYREDKLQLLYDGFGDIGIDNTVYMSATTPNGDVLSNTFTVRINEAASSILPNEILLNGDTQQMEVSSAITQGTYGPYIFEVTDLDDPNDSPTWEAGTDLALSPGQNVPYSQLATYSGTGVSLRDKGPDSNYIEGDYSVETTHQIYGGDQNDYDATNKGTWGEWGWFNRQYCWLTDRVTQPWLVLHPMKFEYPWRVGEKYPWWTGDPKRIWNLPEDGLHITPIGIQDYTGYDWGITFVNGVRGEYPFGAHVLDNKQWFPGEEVDTYDIIGGNSLPSGMSWSGPFQHGSLEYDGTIVPAGSYDYVFVASGGGRRCERRFRITVLDPPFVFGPGGDFDPTTEIAGNSFRSFTDALHSHYDPSNTGVPVVAGCLPFTLDDEVNFALMGQEGYKLNGLQAWISRDPWQRCQEFHFAGLNHSHYGGNGIDRFTWRPKDAPGGEEKGFATSWGNESPLSKITQVLQSFRATNIDTHSFSTTPNYWRIFIYINCRVGECKGATGFRSGAGVGPMQMPAQVHLTDCEMYRCGNNLEHGCYLHAGPVGTVRITRCVSHSHYGGQGYKVFTGGNIYIRDSKAYCHFPLEELSDIAGIQNGTVTGFSADAVIPPAACRRKVFSNNTWYDTRYQVRYFDEDKQKYAWRIIGVARVLQFQGRQEWWNGEHPPYGTTTYMDNDFWQGIINDYATEPLTGDGTYVDGPSATKNPLNPYTFKTFISNDTFYKWEPVDPDVSSMTPHEAIVDGGSHPETSNPPHAGTTGARIYLLTPPAWHERTVVFLDENNTTFAWHPNSPKQDGTLFTKIFEPRLGRDITGSLPSAPPNTIDGTKFPTFSEIPDSHLVIADSSEDWFLK